MNTNYVVIEQRGSGIEYQSKSFTTFSSAKQFAEEMNVRAQTEEALKNGDGNPFNYVVVI